jgi:hypothetical protein
VSVERIGGLLAALNRPTERVLENDQCGGALLFVTRDQAVGMARSGKYRWVLDPERIPEEGAHSWRIACRNDVLIRVRTADLPPDATEEQKANAPKYVVKHGLCSACSGMEIAMRKYLQNEQKKAEEQSRPGGGRRRSFKEEAAE